MSSPEAAEQPNLLERLTTQRGLVLLFRNTVASSIGFVVGLAVLWLLVHLADANKLIAGAASFISANTIHYLIGRSWIFRGSDRPAASGYAFFVVNGVIGLVLTMLIFAALLWLGMNYLIARLVTSLIAGLVMFVLNATLNFHVL